MVDQAEIHRLAQSKKVEECREAARLLEYNFANLPDKKQAWGDLHRLTQDKYTYVRWCAADVLGSAYQHIPGKRREEAWEDLHRLTQDKYTYVRWSAAYALGSAYQHIPEKRRKEAWKDLHRLTQDKHGDVRGSAYHSLGRASIFKATEAESESDFRKEIEKALGYFESSSKVATFFNNPARFCLPFYRSFYTITFRKEEAGAEVQKYLAEAKNAVRGSESKEKLLEVVENIANALKEAQKVKEIGLNTMRSDLDAYRRYIERAEDLLETTEEEASGATKLIKKGLPIIDEKIKGIIEHIYKNAKALCERTKGTPFEEVGKDVNRIGQTFLQIKDPIALENGVKNILFVLSVFCSKMPETCELLKRAKEEQYIEERVNWIPTVLSNVLSQVDKFHDETLTTLKKVEADTGEIKADVKGIKNDIEYLKSELKARFDEIGKNLDDIARGNEAIKDLLRSLLTKTEEYLTDLLDESKKGDPEAQDFIKKFSDAIIKKLEERDEDWFENLRDELIKNEDKIGNEIASASPEIKSKWRKWIDDVKNKMGREIKEIMRGLPREAAIIATAEKILEYGVPFLSEAIKSPVALPACILILYITCGRIPKEVR